jgi:hypothetical protein
VSLAETKECQNSVWLIAKPLRSYPSYACSLLGSTNSSASCTAIGGNGTTGVYGPLEYCSPAVKLSYVFSAYYESQGRVGTACDFSGNATLASNRELLVAGVQATSSQAA